MENFPERHRNHQIETLSKRFFESCLPISWVVNAFQTDYGTDYNCEITTGKKVTGNNFSIQLKGKETEPNNKEVKIILKRANINRWLNKLEPTMIIVFIVDEKDAFWIWFKNDTVDLTLNNESFTISIPRHNKLSRIDWNLVSQYVSGIFSKRYLLYQEPKLDEKNEEGWKAFFANQFEKALSIFYELIKQKPKDASILQGIALSEYHLFNYAKALVSINKALQIDSNVSFNLNKASILTEQGFLHKDNSKISEAIDIYQKTAESGHISYELFYNYGSALSKIKDHEKSINYFTKALHIDPNKAEAWNNLGNAYMETGQHDLEMWCYDKALKIDPDLAETLFSKGSSLFRYFGNVKEGLPLMIQATEKTNRYEIDHPSVFFWIAEAYLSKGDFENSLKWNCEGLTFFSSDSFLVTQKARINEIKKRS